LGINREIMMNYEYFTEAKSKVTKASLNAAVDAMRLYKGSMGKTRIRDQQKLYNRAIKKIEAIAKKAGMDFEDAFDQISAIADKRGPVVPVPGKDI
jgi:hypothetical protein